MSRRSKKAFNWFRRDPEKDRYYLLPGMGGRALRRKQRFILSWTAVAGVLVAAIVGALIYWLNKGY